MDRALFTELFLLSYLAIDCQTRSKTALQCVQTVVVRLDEVAGSTIALREGAFYKRDVSQRQGVFRSFDDR
jgi:hypothetical protein